MQKHLINESIDRRAFNYSSINVQSLSKQFVDLLAEPNIQENRLILVQQTCLKPADNTSMYEMENFQSHFIKRGNGKGVAVYFKEEFQFKSLVSKPEYQISKFGSEDEDVVCIYRSTTTNLDLQREFLEDIKSMIDTERRQIFFGDFNIEATGNIISREFKSWNFTQLVNFPTHEDGGTIDFCLVSDKIPLSSVELRQRAVPWSDHDFLQLTFV